jgi:hypothetical protein
MRNEQNDNKPDDSAAGRGSGDESRPELRDGIAVREQHARLAVDALEQGGLGVHSNLISIHCSQWLTHSNEASTAERVP